MAKPPHPMYAGGGHVYCPVCRKHWRSWFALRKYRWHWYKKHGKNEQPDTGEFHCVCGLPAKSQAALDMHIDVMSHTDLGAYHWKATEKP